MSGLDGQRVVVLGGSEGIGLAVAEGAVAQGASVVVASRSAEKVARAQDRLGPAAEGRVLDLTDEAAVAAFFDALGAFDHLVVCAVTPAFGRLVDLPNEAAERILSVKFWGAFWAVKHAARHIAERGSITLYGGLAAHRSGSGEAVLAFAQGGTEAFARALAVELAPVRVNCVCPGITVTPLWEIVPDGIRHSIWDEARATLPARCIADAADAAEPALYLMRNRFTTGETIVVDGGARLV